jgi:DNA-binding CsgD family transcriptional regulator
MKGLTILDKFSALSALLLEMYRSCREAPVGDYQRWALDRLKQHVPFDAALWASFRLDVNIAVIHNIVLVNRPPEMMREYEKVKHEDELAYRSFASPGVACISNFVADSPGTSLRVAAYVRKWRIVHAMSLHMVDPLTKLATAIALWREEASLPFDEEGRMLFQHVVPHLIETYGVNRIVHMESATAPRREAAHASAAADRLGRLQIASPAFQRLLLEEWPGWSGYHLPDAVRALLRGRNGSRLVGKRITIKSAPMNDIYLLKAREKHSADTLSEREREVARLVASGLTRKQAAQRLGIAPATVRNHMTAVFDKLGISKQSELASALRLID